MSDDDVQGARLIGRRRESEVLDRLVSDVLSGRSGVLVLRGKAGVGKSALLRYLSDRVVDCHVARAVGVESEVELAYIGSFLHGTMANALPHAIGAALANPGRQIVAMCGDGGLAMLLGELLTVRSHNLPITIVVFNNSALGMVELEMLVDGFPSHGTASGHVNYADIATAMGLDAVRITDPGDLRDGLKRALADSKPVLVDVVTDSLALSIPPQVTAHQIRGFATAAAHTVLAGGVGRMLDLARANLRNIRAV